MKEKEGCETEAVLRGRGERKNTGLIYLVRLIVRLYIDLSSARSPEAYHIFPTKPL